ncbi:MAG: hypothetical protein JNL92_14540 [Opitutaceae bacterium]|nr:hypothetical protein [Opitutaceae bacterium]
MSRPSIASRLLATALCALALGMGTAQGAESSTAARERAKKGATTAADLKKLLDEAGKQRDALIADYEALRKELVAATEEQKQAIRQKMEERKKAFEEMTIALHKQIRDEQRKQRAGAAKR